MSRGYLRFALVSLLAIWLLSGCGTKSHSLLVIENSKYDMAGTIDKFSKLFAKKGYKKVDIIDNTVIAKRENIYLRPLKALVINNDKISSALMTCNASLAIEMPIRISIYEELGGNVKYSYTQPEYWSLKHNIKDKNCISVVLQIARDFDEISSQIAKSDK